MEFIVEKSGIKICSKVKLANDMFSRIKGLMFAKRMNGFDGIMIDPCNSIHTFFMRFDIDVIFLDSNNKIVKIIRSMKPWRMSLLYIKSKKVLELNGGDLDLNIKEGDTLEIKCLN